MSSQLVTENVWKTLTTATRQSRQPVAVAVACFGQGAAKLLPLPPRSRLVVDVSEAAVKSGQTCPEELEKLVKNDVRVYTLSNLHAKVFVLGRRAFIGSANVSRHSADTLIEALVATSDREVVAAARQFVRGLYLQELGPEELHRLQRMYRPPHYTGTGDGQQRRQKRGVRPRLPRLLLAQLTQQNPPDGSEATEEAGAKTAARSMDKRRRHALEDFFWAGRCPFRAGDVVVQVLTENDGRKMVSPPGTVVHTRVWRRGAKSCTFIYLELPRRRRIALERLAKQVGAGAKERLRRGGKVNRDFAARLLAAWSG